MFGGCLKWEELISQCRQKAERAAGHGCVLEGCSPSHTLPLLRSLQIIAIIIQKKMNENDPVIWLSDFHDS